MYLHTTTNKSIHCASATAATRLQVRFTKITGMGNSDKTYKPNKPECNSATFKLKPHLVAVKLWLYSLHTNIRTLTERGYISDQQVTFPTSVGGASAPAPAAAPAAAAPAGAVSVAAASAASAPAGEIDLSKLFSAGAQDVERAATLP